MPIVDDDPIAIAELAVAEILLPSSGVVAEILSATDTSSAVLISVNTVGETVSAADAQSTTAIFPKSVTESGAAADAQSSTAIFPRAVGEAGSAVDTQSTAAVFTASDAETAGAVDTNVGSVGSVTYNDTVAETASAADTEDAALVASATVSETASAADTSDGTISGGATAATGGGYLGNFDVNGKPKKPAAVDHTRKDREKQELRSQVERAFAEATGAIEAIEEAATPLPIAAQTAKQAIARAEQYGVGLDALRQLRDDYRQAYHAAAHAERTRQAQLLIQQARARIHAEMLAAQDEDEAISLLLLN